MSATWSPKGGGGGVLSSTETMAAVSSRTAPTSHTLWSRRAENTGWVGGAEGGGGCLGGLARLHSARPSVTLSMHPGAVSAASQARCFTAVASSACSRSTRALSLSLNRPSRATFSRISQRLPEGSGEGVGGCKREKSEHLSPTCPVSAVTGHRALSLSLSLSMIN